MYILNIQIINKKFGKLDIRFRQYFDSYMNLISVLKPLIRSKLFGL